MSSTAPGKVCVIGLDGASFSVLDKWIAAGVMPNLAALIAEGARGDLISTMPPVTGPAWTSMTTGVNPGKHGVYDFVKWYSDNGRVRIIGDRDCHAPRLWDLIGAEGRRVGMYRIPVTHPARPVNGFIVSGMLAPVPGPDVVYPRSLYDDLSEEGLDWFEFEEREFEPRHFAAKNLAEHQHRDRAVRALLERHDPDFFMFVSSEVDHLQHMLWPYCVMEPEGRDSAVRRTVREFYSRVDDTIGYLRRRFGPDTTFFVVSDHGFGVLRGRFRLNGLLWAHGLLRVRPLRLAMLGIYPRIAPLVKAASARLGLLWLARKFVPRAERLAGRRGKRGGRRDVAVRRCVDWEHTRACMLSASDCGIHVNVRGRTEDGIVEPGAEYERVVRRVIQLLKKVRDPETGGRLFTEILRREEVFEGPFVDVAPDIMVILRNGEFIADKWPTRPWMSTSHFTGMHRREGVFAACGPGIVPGSRLTPSILDVAPTVLYSLGIPVPSYMDGKVLDGIYSAEHLQGRPVLHRDFPLASARQEHAAPATDSGDDDIVRARLRNLGYL